ncbi:hypothetical protein Tco_0632083, partial [Tanacetum coccineum]
GEGGEGDGVVEMEVEAGSWCRGDEGGVAWMGCWLVVVMMV